MLRGSATCRALCWRNKWNPSFKSSAIIWEMTKNHPLVSSSGTTHRKTLRVDELGGYLPRMISCLSSGMRRFPLPHPKTSSLPLHSAPSFCSKNCVPLSWDIAPVRVLTTRISVRMTHRAKIIISPWQWMYLSVWFSKELLAESWALKHKLGKWW